jgi:hypothetical protein
MKPDYLERFWSCVKKTPKGCWLWTGTKSLGGYGQLYCGVINGKSVMTRAHRFSYEIHVGPIPKGLTLDHLCRRPSCVNPSHLEPVTIKENTRRGFGPTAINSRKKFCTNGHEFTRANIIMRPTGRHCRECKLEANRQWRARRKRALRRGQKGSAYWTTRKLTESDIVRLRKLAAAGATTPQLVKEFGVNRSNVRRIVLGQAWTHVAARDSHEG